MRGDFTRGILASVYTACPLDEEAARKLYADYYAAAAFTHATTRSIDLKQVVNTNKALVGVSKYGDKLHIVSVIDNLLKGASGQAVQNMNLMFARRNRGAAAERHRNFKNAAYNSRFRGGKMAARHLRIAVREGNRRDKSQASRNDEDGCCPHTPRRRRPF